MIQAPDDIWASYSDADGSKVYERVIAFRGDGAALILRRNGRLVPADEPENFSGICWGDPSQP